MLWWLHDAFVGYGYLSHLIPRTLERNIRVCAVGSHATAAMHTHRPDFEIGQLVYGLPDYAQDTFSPYDIGYAGGLPLFVSVGAFEMRKGQDVLVEAIRLLPASTRAKAAFLFVGKGADKRLLAQVRQLTEEYPRNVFYVERLTRDEIKSLMDQCACTVCSSRDDPMPTFVTEGLIFGKPGIVSEHTGTAGLITEGVDGLCLPQRQPQPAGRSHGQADRPSRPGRPDGPRLPRPLPAVLFQAGIRRHPPGADPGPAGPDFRKRSVMQPQKIAESRTKSFDSPDDPWILSGLYFYWKVHSLFSGASGRKSVFFAQSLPFVYQQARRPVVY